MGEPLELSLLYRPAAPPLVLLPDGTPFLSPVQVIVHVDGREEILSLTMVVEGGKPVITSLTVTRPAAPGVTAEQLRDLPIEQILDKVIQRTVAFAGWAEHLSGEAAEFETARLAGERG